MWCQIQFPVTQLETAVTVLECTEPGWLVLQNSSEFAILNIPTGNARSSLVSKTRFARPDPAPVLLPKLGLAPHHSLSVSALGLKKRHLPLASNTSPCLSPAYSNTKICIQSPLKAIQKPRSFHFRARHDPSLKVHTTLHELCTAINEATARLPCRTNS